MFETLIGKQRNEISGSKVKHRTAVKAVIMQDDQILLMNSNRGDYKFPGGGLEAEETLVEALQREVREETGFVHCVVRELIGIVTQRYMDLFDDDTIFEMTSHYYRCELLDREVIPQQLEEYESELEMTPSWVTLDEAITCNEQLMDKFENNQWIKRENFVLKELKKLYE
ncbi:NUDIX domain-containing protein [Rossellomorea aquimaris]|uniref:NUDIX hydrolase n=1 Tax=Rossellomorea aquimaris TaxID=189382 RepID=UPI001CD808FD|nr:NUDIX domain-containing protein [Rossellomorea aquimaris]MCA1058849.1 NUDIX domain-containing protein [Rossellomorea aquimaris]